ncbi:hypothetical protein FJR41_007180, partial [Dolichospermum planctonicum UHCC 0167]|nr:hypothetical protein [Dolichospermum planctonicum UHCC 0167]
GEYVNNYAVLAAVFISFPSLVKYTPIYSLLRVPCSLIENTGCSCANCVQTNLDKLQGKLPMVGA